MDFRRFTASLPIPLQMAIGCVVQAQEVSEQFRRLDRNKDGKLTQNLRVAPSMEPLLDVPYAGTDNPRQRLDLSLPKVRKDDKPLPTVAFMHGGAWQNSGKRGRYRMITPLVESGEYIGASLG